MDTSSLNDLLADWTLRLTKAQIGHYLATERYVKLHYTIGILLVISSTFVSSSFFQQTKTGIVNYILIGVSISSTILASFQTFIRPSEKAEIHRSKASKYGVLRRKIELFSSGKHSHEEIIIFLDRLQEDWNHVAGDAPLTPKAIRTKIKEILQKEIKDDDEIKNKQVKY
jgi:hypothetical protein